MKRNNTLPICRNRYLQSIPVIIVKGLLILALLLLRCDVQGQEREAIHVFVKPVSYVVFSGSISTNYDLDCSRICEFRS